MSKRIGHQTEKLEPRALLAAPVFDYANNNTYDFTINHGYYSSVHIFGNVNAADPDNTFVAYSGTSYDVNNPTSGFYIDSMSGELRYNSYHITPGSYTFTVTASDEYGGTGTAEIPFRVRASVGTETGDETYTLVVIDVNRNEIIASFQITANSPSEFSELFLIPIGVLSEVELVAQIVDNNNGFVKDEKGDKEVVTTIYTMYDSKELFKKEITADDLDGLYKNQVGGIVNNLLNDSELTSLKRTIKQDLALHPNFDSIYENFRGKHDEEIMAILSANIPIIRDEIVEVFEEKLNSRISKLKLNLIVNKFKFIMGSRNPNNTEIAETPNKIKEGYENFISNRISLGEPINQIMKDHITFEYADIGDVGSFLLDNKTQVFDLLSGKSNELPDFGDLTLIKKIGIGLPLMYVSEDETMEIKGRFDAGITGITVNNAGEFVNTSANIRITTTKRIEFRSNKFLGTFDLTGTYNHTNDNENSSIKFKMEIKY